MITLQFSFSNPDIISESLKRLTPETRDERSERKSRSSGELVINPTEDVNFIDFLIKLESAGYEMVDAFYKERVDGKDSKGKRKYHMMRFIFSHNEYVDLCDEFKDLRDNIYTELLNICDDAMWRVRVFLNPFYENGNPTPNQHAVSINFESRKPYFLNDGNPVVMWKKDESGKRVGEKPIPIEPKHSLQIEDGNICLTAV